MGNLITIVLAGVIVWFASTINVFLGIAAAVAAIAILAYMRYTSICIAVAMRSYAKGETQKAFAWYARGYKHGMTLEQRTNYGYYLTRDGRLEEAEAVFKRMLANKLPQQSRNYAKSNYAITLWKMGRLEEAIDELEEIFPYYKTTSVYGTLGYLYILKEDWPRAKAFNDEAYEYNSDNLVILDNVTQLYYKLGRYEEAEAYADEFAEKNPTFAEGFYDIAQAKEAVGKYDEALEAIAKAEEITPTFMTTVSKEQLAELRVRIELEQKDGQKRFPERKIEFEELPPGSLFQQDDDGWEEEADSEGWDDDDDWDEEEPPSAPAEAEQEDDDEEW